MRKRWTCSLRSDKINALKDKGSRPADLAFLAMTHQQLGHAKEAEAKLQLLRERMKDPRWAKTPRLRASCAKRKNCWQNPRLPAASKPVRAARGRVRSLPSGIRWGPSGASKDLESASVSEPSAARIPPGGLYHKAASATKVRSSAGTRLGTLASPGRRTPWRDRPPHPSLRRPDPVGDDPVIRQRRAVDSVLPVSESSRNSATSASRGASSAS